MKYSIYLLLIFYSNVLSDKSSSFCLCTLKNILEEYALMSTNHLPPRYISSNKNDIGFYVVPSRWKPVNDATWIELRAMINAPSGMYTHISLDGINPINNGLPFDNLRSSHLADIITEYRSIIDRVTIYYQNLIENRTKTCLDQTRKSLVGFDLKSKWQQFFIPRLN